MIRLADSVQMSRVDEETVLLDSASGKYFGLNAVGSRFVELLLQSGDGETALQRALAEYDAPDEQIRGDFHTLLENLDSRGLIHRDAE